MATPQVQPSSTSVEYQQLLAKFNALQAENSRLKTARTPDLTIKRGEKGGVSVYGLGRFPVTLYFRQWLRLLAAADKIRAFIDANRDTLADKSAE